MTRALQKIGNSKGIVLTRTMLEHLGITDKVELSFEDGRIVLTAPVEQASKGEEIAVEAKAEPFSLFGESMRRLADVPKR